MWKLMKIGFTMERQTSMWNNLNIILFAVFGLCFASCQNDDEIISQYTGDEIRLNATVENNVMSRSAYTLTLPSKENPLEVAVWASTTPRKYENLGQNGRNDDGIVSMYTTANFTNNQEQLLDDAVYPKTGKPVYFIGLHPKDKWLTGSDGSGNNGISAVRTFTGCEDIMFAPEIFGQYGMNKENWPKFKFKHLLTWLRVCVAAESEAVSNAWGKLKSMKIKSFNTVTVELDKDFDNNNCLNYSRSDQEKETLLDFYKTGTDTKFLDENISGTWYALPYDVAPQEVAYVLCAPVEATEFSQTGERTAEYTLVIETENRSVELPIDLMVGNSYFTGNTRRNQFILNLTFKMGSNIAVAATVSDWRAGGMGIVELNPNNPLGSEN